MQQGQQRSQLHSKRQSFHNQIRSKFRNEYFATQRMLLHQAQLSQVQGHEQVITFHSIQQIKEHMVSSFLPNYHSVSEYLKQHNGEPVPRDFVQLIYEKSIKPDFLKNQSALVLLITLWNTNNVDHSLLRKERIQELIHGVIRHNLVLEDYQHQIYRIDYFSTVCWTLFTLMHVLKDATLFEPIKQYLRILQNQSHQIRFQLISLLSELSTNPQLLPSQVYIQKLLHQSVQFAGNKRFMAITINLLDNYLRYNTQQLHRFQQQQNAQLAANYINFISLMLQQLKLIKDLKIELIKLLTSLIKSSSPEVLRILFQQKESTYLAEQLFYRCQFAEWDEKVASLICFKEIAFNEQLFDIIAEIVSPEQLTSLCVNSLLLPDKKIQILMLSGLNFMLERKPEVYRRLALKYKFPVIVRSLQLKEEKNPQQNHHEQFKVVDVALFIYDKYLMENEYQI